MELFNKVRNGKGQGGLALGYFLGVFFKNQLVIWEYNNRKIIVRDFMKLSMLSYNIPGYHQNPLSKLTKWFTIVVLDHPKIVNQACGLILCKH